MCHSSVGEGTGRHHHPPSTSRFGACAIYPVRPTLFKISLVLVTNNITENVRCPVLRAEDRCRRAAASPRMPLADLALEQTPRLALQQQGRLEQGRPSRPVTFSPTVSAPAARYSLCGVARATDVAARERGHHD